MAATTGVAQTPIAPVQPYQDRPGLLHALATKLRSETVATLDNAGVYRNCLTCLAFLEHLELCEKHSQRPPARIIAYGCPDHSDIIPF